MLRLNIIPQELKNEKKLKAFFESLRIFLAITIIIFCAYGIMLLAAKFILQLHFFKVMNSAYAAAGSAKNIDKPTRNINDQMKFLDEIQKNTIAWSYLIEYLSNNSGSGIRYNKIEINKKNESIEISGFAEHRDDLIRFKETMGKSNYFTAVNLPIKNLLEKINITFKISAKINNYEFVPR